VLFVNVVIDGTIFSKFWEENNYISQFLQQCRVDSSDSNNKSSPRTYVCLNFSWASPFFSLMCKSGYASSVAIVQQPAIGGNEFRLWVALNYQNG